MRCLTGLRNRHTCQRKAASEAEEDEELNESRAFVELTEYVANAMENDHMSIYLPNFRYISHTLQSH